VNEYAEPVVSLALDLAVAVEQLPFQGVQGRGSSRGM
jgi:hypothetical protein